MIVRYFILQLKQTLKQLLKESIGLLAAFVIICLALVIITKATSEEKTASLLKVGVSLCEDDELSKLALDFVRDYGSVQSICDFSEVDETEIIPKIEAGELDAGILIPDSFVKAADSGENIPAVFYFPTKQTGKSLLFRELVSDALRYIQTSQGVVYATYNIASQNTDGLKIDYYSIGDYLAEKLFFQWGKKDNYFENTVVLPFGKFNYYQFYLFVGLILVFVVSLSRLGYLYDKPSKAIEQYLGHKGIGGASLNTIRCLVVWGLIMIHSGMYWLLILLVRYIGNIYGISILFKMEYPLSFFATVCVGGAISLIFHAFMLIKCQLTFFAPRLVRYILSFLILLFLFVAMGSVVYRNSEPNSIGIMIDSDSEAAAKLGHRLENLDTQLEITTYDSVEQLEYDVSHENIDSGFYITEDEERRLVVRGISGTFSFGSLVAQETIYTQIYAETCKELLLKEADNIFERSDTLKSMLAEQLQDMSSGQMVLQSEIVEVNSGDLAETKEDSKPYKFMSILAILLLVAMLANCYEKLFTAEGKAIALVLRGNRNYINKPMIVLAGLVAMAYVGNILITERGKLETLLLFPVIYIYTLLAGKIFDDKSKYRVFQGAQLLVALVIVVFVI